MKMVILFSVWSIYIRFVGIVEITIRTGDRKNLPKWDLPSFSIIHVKNLVTTGESTAVIELEEPCFLAVWSFDAIERTLFDINGYLPVFHRSYFNPRSGIRKFTFESKKVEILFQMTTCSRCILLLRHIINTKHRHCSITVSFNWFIVLIKSTCHIIFIRRVLIV